jgi:ferredoxin
MFPTTTLHSIRTAVVRSVGRHYCQSSTKSAASTKILALWARQSQCYYSSSRPSSIAITYMEADGTEKTVDAQVGQHLLDVAHNNNIELEGACGGELACSTCHLIFEQDVYDQLPEMESEEEDMLDLAFEVTDTSRLGCQIKVTEAMEGMKVRIPDDGFNVQVKA